MQQLQELKIFPVVVNVHYPNVQYIYPLKQKLAAQVRETVSQYKSIRKVWIFGSSVTNRCNIDSDLDICIDFFTTNGMEIYEIQNKVGNLCNWNCDILVYSNLGKFLKNTIEKEGVVIYEQSA